MNYKIIFILLTGSVGASYLTISKDNQYGTARVYIQQEEIEAIWYPEE